MAQALTRGHYAYSLRLARLKHVRPELSHLVNQARPGQAFHCLLGFFLLFGQINHEAKAPLI